MKRLILIVFYCSFYFSVVANESIQTGIELFESKNYKSARYFFTEFIQQNPNHAGAYYYLGRTDFEENKYNNAIDNFDKAIINGGENYLYFFWRGRTHLNLLMEANLMMKAVYSGRTLRDFEKAVVLNPDDLESRIYLAEYYGQAPTIAGGNGAKSIAHFRIAIKKHPLTSYPYMGLGNQYRNLGKYDSAFYYYNKYIEIDPDDPLIHFEIGKAGSISGNELSNAEKSLLKSLEAGLDKGHQIDAYYLLGQVRERLNKRDLARQAYHHCLKLKNDHSDCKKALRKLN